MCTCLFSIDSIVFGDFPFLLFKCNQDSFIEKAVMLDKELRNLNSSLAIWDPLNEKKTASNSNHPLEILHTSRPRLSTYCRQFQADYDTLLSY